MTALHSKAKIENPSTLLFVMTIQTSVSVSFHQLALPRALWCALRAGQSFSSFSCWKILLFKCNPFPPKGHLLPRSVSSFLCCRSVSAPYSTQPQNPSGAQPQQWHTLDPELEEILIPRKLSISPLESWLTVRYSLPKAEGAQEEENPQPSECPPAAGTGDVEEGEGALSDKVQCRNVLKIRRRKMNRHKYRKLLKRRKFIRRKIKEGRKKRRQVRSGEGEK